jgi:hypothetical protein
MIPGQINIAEDLDQALEDFDEDLPQIARDVDQA